MSHATLFHDPAYCPCHGCGYDLRANAGDACPECGSATDAASDRSTLPWAHRQSLGPFRACVRTAWLATVHPARLVVDASRPQHAYDARTFARITAVAACIPGVAMIVGYVLARDGLDLEPLLEHFGPVAVWPELVMVAAFVTGWTMIAAIVSAAQVYWFDLRQLSDPLRGRAVSLGRYCSAGWALTIVPLTGIGLIRILMDLNAAGLMTPGMISIVAAGTAASLLLIVGAVMRSTWVVLTRLSGCGWRSKLGLMFGLPAVYLAGAGFCLIVLPGACLLWLLMILSLR